MNVIVSNRQKEIIDNANIDAIKDLNGLFSVDDLINKFKNYFFSKMILDATSVVNFASKEVLTKLADEIGADKLIILLPSKPEPPEEFKKMLIETRIYNFSNKIEDVVRFIDKPNTLDDIINPSSNKTNDETGNNNENGNNDYFNNNVNNNFVENNDSMQNVEINQTTNNENYSNNNTTTLDSILNNFSVNTSNNVDTNSVETNNNVENNEIDNSNEKSLLNLSNLMGINQENNNNTNNNSFDYNNGETPSSPSKFLITDGFDNNLYESDKKEKKVIGIKNITSHAGSTTLVYSLKRFADSHGIKALGVELNNNDFRLFRDRKMISIDESNVNNVISESTDDVIFIDLNNCEKYDFCSDVLYLVEPSIIKLNGLMANNKNIFNELRGKKVIVNNCMLTQSDIRALSSEAGIEFFYILAPFNDRGKFEFLSELFERLNIK